MGGDADLRSAEREWCQSGSALDLANYLRALLRAGVPPGRVLLLEVSGVGPAVLEPCLVEPQVVATLFGRSLAAVRRWSWGKTKVGGQIRFDLVELLRGRNREPRLQRPEDMEFLAVAMHLDPAAALAAGILAVQKFWSPDDNGSLAEGLWDDLLAAISRTAIEEWWRLRSGLANWPTVPPRVEDALATPSFDNLHKVAWVAIEAESDRLDRVTGDGGWECDRRARRRVTDYMIERLPSWTLSLPVL